MRGLRGKARKSPIGTVSVCLKKNNVGKLILYDSDVENVKTYSLTFHFVGKLIS